MAINPIYLPPATIAPAPSVNDIYVFLEAKAELSLALAEQAHCKRAYAHYQEEYYALAYKGLSQDGLVWQSFSLNLTLSKILTKEIDAGNRVRTNLHILQSFQDAGRFALDLSYPELEYPSFIRKVEPVFENTHSQTGK
jgi:hypothetical protein